MAMGQGLQLGLSARVYNSSNAQIASTPVTWTSTDPSVATVSPTGWVIGVGAGQTAITAWVGSDVYATVRLTVAPVWSVSLYAGSTLLGASRGMDLGAQLALKAKVYSAAGAVLTGVPIGWTSSNPAVASVSASGVVKGVALGSATITVRTSTGVFTQVKITVNPVVGSVKLYTGSTALGSSRAINQGAQLTLSAKVYSTTSALMTGVPVSWSSSNSALVSVTTAGVIKGVGVGSATITAKTSNGKQASVVVTVSPVIGSVKLYTGSTALASTRAINQGSSLTLTAKVYSTYGVLMTGVPVTWSSSNAALVSVTTAGVIKGVGVGSATITAKTSNGKLASVVITVNQVIGSVKLYTGSAALGSSRTINQGSSLALTAKVYSTAGALMTGVPVSWSSSNYSVASVSTTGLIKSGAVGSAKITAKTSTGVYAVVSVSVAQVAGSVKLYLGSTAVTTVQTMKQGTLLALSAKVYSTMGALMTDEPVSWSSSDPSILSVSPEGLVKGAGGGSAKITAKTSNGVWASAGITVIAVPASIRIYEGSTEIVSGAGISLPVGVSKTFTVRAYDSNGHELSGVSFTWKTSNSNVARSNGSGTLTGVASGMATITAGTGSISKSFTAYVK
jgi:uncharacterized protein YjdB